MTLTVFCCVLTTFPKYYKGIKYNKQGNNSNFRSLRLLLPPHFGPAVLTVLANPTLTLGCQPELLLIAY